jgi:hypothetical protein
MGGGGGHGNGTSNAIKGGEFLEQLSDYRLLNKNSAPLYKRRLLCINLLCIRLAFTGAVHEFCPSLSPVCSARNF